MPDTQFILIVSILIIGLIVGITFIILSQIKKLKTDLKSDESGVLMEWLKEMKGAVDKNSDVLEKQLNNQGNAGHTNEISPRSHERPRLN